MNYSSDEAKYLRKQLMVSYNLDNPNKAKKDQQKARYCWGGELRWVKRLLIQKKRLGLSAQVSFPFPESFLRIICCQSVAISVSARMHKDDDTMQHDEEIENKKRTEFPASYLCAIFFP